MSGGAGYGAQAAAGRGLPRGQPPYVQYTGAGRQAFADVDLDPDLVETRQATAEDLPTDVTKSVPCCATL